VLVSSKGLLSGGSSTIPTWSGPDPQIHDKVRRPAMEELAPSIQTAGLFSTAGKTVTAHWVLISRAGEDCAVPHDFGRIAVRNRVGAGIPERVCMPVARQKTRSVLDRYHIVSDGDLKEAAGRLDRVFSPQRMTMRLSI